ncbi:early nodulin-75-like [Prunus avium]|uniref:Early nodulin-75-like n=1 Tax=Prunus avium TaxID=42229 RepID=A0A6P5RU99_PRUAV|nr:early nodulin-75-like [Prunus avium]
MSPTFLLVVFLGVLLLTTCSLADHDHHKPPHKPPPLGPRPPHKPPPLGPRPPPKHKLPTPLDNEAAVPLKDVEALYKPPGKKPPHSPYKPPYKPPPSN